MEGCESFAMQMVAMAMKRRPEKKANRRIEKNNVGVRSCIWVEFLRIRGDKRKALQDCLSMKERYLFERRPFFFLYPL